MNPPRLKPPAINPARSPSLSTSTGRPRPESAGLGRENSAACSGGDGWDNLFTGEHDDRDDEARTVQFPLGDPTAKLLHETLQRAAEFMARHPSRPPGLVYGSGYEFVLAHGTWFAFRPRPAKYEAGAPRSCFGNSIYACVRYPGLRYVEGFAAPAGFTALPIHHAWNLDASGGLVDLTWTEGLAYVGVEFSVERADDCTWNGDASILDDCNRGWPLFRQPWTGEKPILGYYPTEALKLARRLARQRGRRSRK